MSRESRWFQSRKLFNYTLFHFSPLNSVNVYSPVESSQWEASPLVYPHHWIASCFIIYYSTSISVIFLLLWLLGIKWEIFFVHTTHSTPPSNYDLWWYNITCGLQTSFSVLNGNLVSIENSSQFQRKMKIDLKWSLNLSTSDVLPYGVDDSLVGVLPFFHIYGQVVVFLSGLFQGAKITTMPRFEPEVFLQILNKQRVRSRPCIY